MHRQAYYEKIRGDKVEWMMRARLKCSDGVKPWAEACHQYTSHRTFSRIQASNRGVELVASCLSESV